MIDSGVTSFVDILEGPNSIPGALAVEKEEVEKAGLRGFLSCICSMDSVRVRFPGQQQGKQISYLII
jgi:hypothetical protein